MFHDQDSGDDEVGLISGDSDEYSDDFGQEYIVEKSSNSAEIVDFSGILGNFTQK